MSLYLIVSSKPSAFKHVPKTLATALSSHKIILTVCLYTSSVLTPYPLQGLYTSRMFMLKVLRKSPRLSHLVSDVLWNVLYCRSEFEINYLCGIIARTRSHSLMDRMWVCGTYDPGSIPGESTNTKKSTPFQVCHFCWCSHQESNGFRYEELHVMRRIRKPRAGKS